MFKRESPDIERVKELSLQICKEFISFANKYYEEHKGDELLEKISNSYSMYQDLFTETVYNALCLKRRTEYYDKKFLVPFVEHIIGYLKADNNYNFCLANSEYFIMLINRMIDSAIFKLMMSEQTEANRVRVKQLFSDINIKEAVIADECEEN